MLFIISCRRDRFRGLAGLKNILLAGFLLTFSGAASRAATFNYTDGATGGSAGNWSAGANWDQLIPPNSIGDSAILGNIITGTKTVTVDGFFVCGSLTFTTSASGRNYTLAASSGKNLTLNQDNAGSGSGYIT